MSVGNWHCYENRPSPAFLYFLLGLMRFSSAQQRGNLSLLPSQSSMALLQPLPSMNAFLLLNVTISVFPLVTGSPLWLSYVFHHLSFSLFSSTTVFLDAISENSQSVNTSWCCALTSFLENPFISFFSENLYNLHPSSFWISLLLKWNFLEPCVLPNDINFSSLWWHKRNKSLSVFFLHKVKKLKVFYYIKYHFLTLEIWSSLV